MLSVPFILEVAAVIEKHHIVFRKQGGLDFELNYKYLTSEYHREDNGPHKCRATDMKYKRELQEALEGLLTKDYYNIAELINLLGLRQVQANKAFRKLLKVNGIERKAVIFRLMGNRFYL